MEITEIWSISQERINEFLLAIGGIPLEDAGGYSFDGCQVRLTVLPDRMIGRYPICRTQVHFSGEEEKTERIHRAFKLRFLSAGG